jgi:transketolase
LRKAFISKLVDLAGGDESIYLLVGDIGFHLVEPFAEAFPERFVNVGIAEQNMAGIAAGLALSGKNVFCYSIANFPTLRCVEQIRNDICSHRANVKIVAGGTGIIYGALGMTHHTTDDIAIMRALPDMTVIAPGDPVETMLATEMAGRYSGPCYLRLGRTGDPKVHEEIPGLVFGKAIRLRHGDDVTIIASGGLLYNALKAAEQLTLEGITAELLSMPFIKPLDNTAVLEAAGKTGNIVTIEEHSIIGGLGSAVAEVLAEADIPDTRFKRIGLPDEIVRQVGNQDYLRDFYSLSVEGITSTVKSLLSNQDYSKLQK